MPRRIRAYEVNGIAHFDPEPSADKPCHCAEFIPPVATRADQHTAGVAWYKSLNEKLLEASIISELLIVLRRLESDRGSYLSIRWLPCIYRIHTSRADLKRAEAVCGAPSTT